MGDYQFSPNGYSKPTEIYDKLCAIWQSEIKGNMDQTKWGEEQNKAFASAVIDLIYMVLPMDDENSIRETRKLITEMDYLLGVNKETGDTSRNIANRIRAQLVDVVHNPNHIVIKTTCGEERTIEMSQPISDIAYMGNNYSVDSEDGIEEKLEGLGALFG